MGYLIVFIGGGLGAAFRHAANRLAASALGPSFPFSTFIVNVFGSFALGVVAGLFLTKGVSDQSVRLFLTTGLLGGFTTFSAFSLDTALMWQKGEWLSLAIYVAGSVMLSVAALFLGMGSARALG